MLGHSGDIEIDLESTKDAVAMGARRDGPRTSPPSPLRTMSAVRPNAASVVVLGEHGGRDADVHAAVEEIVRGATEAGGPGDGDREVADGWSAALGDDLVDDLAGLGDGVSVVVGVQGREIADEVLVGHAELHGEGLDQVIVEVDAARQDER